MAKPHVRGLSVRSKIWGLVLFLTLVAIGVGGIGYYGFSRSNAVLSDISEHFLPKLALVDDIDFRIATARGYEKEFFLFSSLDSQDETITAKQSGYHTKLIETYQEIGRKIAELHSLENRSAQGVSSLGSRDEIKQLLKRVEQANAESMATLKPLAEQLFAGKNFLEVADTYAIYKGRVLELEAGVKGIREKILGNISGEKAKASEFRKFLTQLLLAAGAGVICLGGGIALLVSRQITTAIHKLTVGIRAAGEGQFDAIEIVTRDEFAEIARSFNETMDQLKRYIQTDQERQITEQNLIGFLEVVSEAADGDLTVKAPVTADAFGSIADAYNLMVESLAELMSETRQRAVEVGSETQRLLEIFHDMEDGAEAQSGKVQEATMAVNQTADATHEIANKATSAHEVSVRVDLATGQGNELVNRNIEGMQLIRVTVQTINKKMKSLSERLLEIGTISELISEIATRTTILAMNASIEASRAGEQGRGFLVISDEIKKLADKSSEATKQIGGIIKAIQTEAGEVTTVLEEETRTVEDQTRLVKDTGEAFGRIEAAISGSRAVVDEIFRLSDNQKTLTNDAVGFIDSVSSLSLTTRQMLKDSARITEGLNAMSETLLTAIAQFKLPGASYDVAEETIDLIEEVEDLETIDFYDGEGEAFDLTAS